MLKTLCAIRLRLFFDALTGSGRRRKSMGVLYGALLIYCVVVFGGLFGMLFWALRPLSDAGLDWLYFALAGILATGLAFAGSVFMTQQQLYDAQDNQLLLSLPISPMAVLGSRMLVLYLYDLVLGAIVLVPATLAWGGEAGFWVRTGLSVILLPLFPLCLSCFFGWLIGLLTVRMRYKNLFSVILTVLFLGAYFLLYAKANAAIQAILTNGQAVAETVEGVLHAFYLFGRGMTGEWGQLLLFFLETVLLFAHWRSRSGGQAGGRGAGCGAAGPALTRSDAHVCHIDSLLFVRHGGSHNLLHFDGGEESLGAQEPAGDARADLSRQAQGPSADRPAAAADQRRGDPLGAAAGSGYGDHGGAGAGGLCCVQRSSGAGG